MKTYKVAYIDSGGLWEWKDGSIGNPRIESIHWNTAAPWIPDSSKYWRGLGEIIKGADQYDIIVMPAFLETEQDGQKWIPDWGLDLIEQLEAKRLWDRVVIWQLPSDDSRLWERALKQCRLYMHRLWPWDRPMPRGLWPFGKDERPPNLHPVDFSAPNAHFDLVPVNLYKRDIGMGYFFGFNRYDTSIWRGKVGKMLREAKWPPGAYLDFDYTLGHGMNFWGHWVRSYPLHGDGQLNWWYVYLHKLRRCKVIFGCSGNSNVIMGGDMRTPQILASGALAFVQKMTIPLPHPYEDGRHCFFYDPTSEDSIFEAIEKAKYYLQPDRLHPERQKEREEMGRRCFEHASKYHRPINRVNYVLDLFERSG